MNASQSDNNIFLKKILLYIFVSVSILYLVWRFTVTQTWGVWYGWPLYISECIGIVYGIVSTWFTRTIIDLHPINSALNKTVDIFIPTYNEPEYIVRMTAIGALNVSGVSNVFILDDGDRKNIKKLAKTLGTKYLSRSKGSHAKAGNLNNALLHSSAQFIVCLDCDHIPRTDFIAKTLGYFGDEKLAFVQTPQTFYNIDSFQFRRSNYLNTWNEQTMFFDAIQPSKNAFNAAFFCGSCAILRRSAIDSVAGFAIGTITEDIHTSIKMHALGWNSIYLNDQLAFGLAAEDFSEYHKQRVRWCKGGFSLLFRSKDSPLFIKGLTFLQRISYFISMSSPLLNIQKLFYILLPAFVLILLPLSDFEDKNLSVFLYLIIFALYLGLSYFTSYIYSNKTFQPFLSEQYNISNIFSTIEALKGIIFTGGIFNVSIKNKTKNETPTAFFAILVLFIFILVAQFLGLFFWFFILKNNFLHLVHNLILFPLFWNTINMFLVGSFLRFAWLYQKLDKDNYFIKIPDNDSIRVIIPQSYQNKKTIKVIAMGLSEAQLLSPNMIKKGIVTISIILKKNKLLVIKGKCLESRIVKNGYVSRVKFARLSNLAEKELTLFFFNYIVPKYFK